jgi:hypothetical protein
MRKLAAQTCLLLLMSLALAFPGVEVSLAQQDSVPSGVPQQAFSASQKAKAWRQDAILVLVQVNDYANNGNFTLQFSFYSPSNRSGLSVIATESGNPIVTPVGPANWGTQALPAFFLDLPAALQKARAQGMQGKMDHAMLRVTSGGPTWEITPVFDSNLRVYAINASLGAAASPIPAPLAQAARSPSGADRLIVPGQRIGAVSLGMTIGEAISALGLKENQCTALLINGADGGQSSCDFKEFGLSMTFTGDIGSPAATRKASWIGVEAEDGQASRSYATDRGIRIGSSEQDVIKAYGNATKEETPFQDYEIVYTKIGVIFTFGGYGANSEKFADDIVRQVGIMAPTQ